MENHCPSSINILEFLNQNSLSYNNIHLRFLLYHQKVLYKSNLDEWHQVEILIVSLHCLQQPSNHLTTLDHLALKAKTHHTKYHTEPRSVLKDLWLSRSISPHLPCCFHVSNKCSPACDCRPLQSFFSFNSIKKYILVHNHTAFVGVD